MAGWVHAIWQLDSNNNLTITISYACDLSEILKGNLAVAIITNYNNSSFSYSIV